MEFKLVTAVLTAAACVLLAAAQTTDLPDPTIFAPVQTAGASGTGFPAFYVGCASNGATLQDIRVYSNDNFLRGIEVNLTDGRTVQLGCVNTTDGHTGCTSGQLDVGIRQAAFSFAPGERVTALSLFAGPDNRGNANARAGAIRFSTSLGRVFDFGNKKSRNQPVDVDVASGVPCGIAARRGADIDAVGFVFLRNAVASILTDVTYDGLPTAESDGSAFIATYATLNQQNVTYDNSDNTAAHTYTYSSEFAQRRPSQWSHAPGLDSYAGPNVSAGVPQLLTQSGSSKTPAGWQVAPPAQHQRTEDGLQADQWSYNVPVPAGAVYAAHVSLLQARITVPYSGNLTIQLDDGASLSVPVRGVYEGVTYAPANVEIEVIKPGSSSANASLLGTSVATAAPESHSSSTNKGLAIGLGVGLGLLCLIILPAIFFIVRRHRRKQQAASSKVNHLGTVPAAFGGVPGSTDEQRRAVEAGGIAGFAAGKLSFPSKKGMKPVTPRASAAPPSGADSAQSGIARMLPAAMVSKRFQQLFKGKGNAEEDLSVAERGLSTTSTHSQAPEIPLHHEPSPTKDIQAPASTAAPSTGTPEVKEGAAAKLQQSAAAAAAAVAADDAAAAGKRPLPRGSIEHEGLPIRLSGRARSGSVAGSPPSAAAADKMAKAQRIEHERAKIKLGQKYEGPK
ncbi:g4874 [Coccomyxa elongata]